MNGKIWSKIMAVILIMALTLVDVLTIGLNIATFAASGWNHVTFDVYFKGDNGEILSNKAEKIDSENMKLWMKIAVHDEGNFNGQISLDASNFKFKKEIFNDKINKIEENKIILNQINAGEVIEIEVGIQAIRDDKIKLELLNQHSILTINGTYKDSEEKGREIQEQKEVTWILNSPYEDKEGLLLTSEILTNDVYNIRGENKRVIQILLKSGLNGNGYPIQETNIKVSALENMQGINVISRGTIATNGKDETDFNQSNWLYVQQENNVQIKVSNPEQEGNINWNQQGQDEFVVTYLLEENAPIENQEITVAARVSLYDEKQTIKEASTTTMIAERKDGIITTSTNVSETSLYKGKIYAQLERNYGVTTKLYVASDKVNKTIEVDLQEATYQAGEARLDANVQYLTTTIEKQQIERILGQNGKFYILATDGSILAEINQDTQVDENGKITIHYPEGTKQIIIRTTEIAGTGTIQLETTKVIKAENYNREMIRQLQAIQESTSDSSASIVLKETTTAAKVELNQEHLSTLSKNENVEMNLTLCTDDEKYDLYKNPTIEVRLPTNIQTIDVKSINLVYGNNFKEEYTQMIEQNGQKVIQIGLTGEQTNYTADINQTTIVIKADIEFGRLTPSQIQKIEVNYTNQNGQENQYQEAIDMKIESKYGLMLYSQMSAFNQAGDYEYTIDSEVPTGNLDMDCEERVATMGLAILNNYDADMTDVSIVGRIPAKGIYDGTIDTQIVNGIETNLEGITILYSTSSTATVEDNSWTNQMENAKSYKIVLDKVAKSQVIQIKYGFVIPEGLSYGQSLYGKTEVNYTYMDNRMNQTSHIGAETQRLTIANMSRARNAVITKVEDGLDIAISAMTAGSELKEGDRVYEGQTIKYIMKVTNHTGNDLNKLKVQAVQENGKIYDLQGKDAYNDGTNQYNLTSYFWEELDTNTKKFDLESLKNGESTELVYQAVVQEVEGENAITVGNITIEAENLATKEVKTITNSIQQAKLKMMINQANAEELDLYSLNTTSYIIQVKNLSAETLKDVTIEVEMSDGLVFSQPPYDVEVYLPNQDGKEANVLNGVTTNDDRFQIHLSKIEPGEDGRLNVVIHPYLDSVEGDTKEVSIYTKCTFQEEETYFSNISNRTIYQMERNIVMQQTANISEDTLLEDGQQFQISIEIENKGRDIVATIDDLFDDGLLVTEGYWYTEAEGNHTIDVYEQDPSQPDIEYEDGEDDGDDPNFKLPGETGDDKDSEDSEEVERIVIINNKLLVNKNLKQNQKLVIVVTVRVDASKVQDNLITNVVSAAYHDFTIESNVLTFKVKEFKEYDEASFDTITITQKANPEHKSVIGEGKEITYTTTIANTIEEGYYITITDKLPAGIVATKVSLNGEEVTDSYLQDKGTIMINDYLIEETATMELQVNAILIENEATGEELTNFVTVSNGRGEKKSNEITYYLANKNQNGTNHANRTEGETYTISGLAWLDKDKNGAREDKEERISGIKVKVVDATTGSYVQKEGSDLSAMTSSEGDYSFTLKEGSYILVFEYDTNAYTITEYQKSGVAGDRNSDVIHKTVANRVVGVTDTIVLTKGNVEHIDLGLLASTIFDLELNKVVNKVTIENNSGTSVHAYDNAKIAKVEIAAKQLNGSKVTIEYTLHVTNTGEVEGYVKNLVDDMPSSLTFNPALNPNWYQSDTKLYDTSLENSKIQPGETKSVTLLLTKTMTENNTGSISNTAEIADAYNTLGIHDTDSIPGNAVSTEDDFSNADVIISVKTGAIILYLCLILASVAMIGGGIYFIKHKVLK